MSKEFRMLNLNREKIKENINAYLNLYFKEYEFSDFIEKGPQRRRIEIKADNNEFYIDFHFNANGTTTIDDFGGKCEEIKKQLAYYIKSKCTIGAATNDSWFVVKNIEEEDLIAIIEILKESDYYKPNYNIVIENKGDNKVYRLKGKYDENLVITYYSTKTVQVQGKQLLLFNEAITILGELIEVDDIPEKYNNLYQLNINKDAVRERCKLYMCNSYDIITGKFKRCIHQAVYYLFIDADMFDYSAIPLTAFRALEGHIKYVLKDFKIITTKENRVGSFFYKWNKKFILKDEIKNKIIDNSNLSNVEKRISNIEDAYNKYYNLRHILSHWDDLWLENDEDTTEMIDDIGTARTYIEDTLKIIDSYYEL